MGTLIKDTLRKTLTTLFIIVALLTVTVHVTDDDEDDGTDVAYNHQVFKAK